MEPEKRILRDFFFKHKATDVPADWLGEAFIGGKPVTASQAKLKANSDNSEFELLREEVLACEKCRLAEGRNKVVFGTGNSNNPEICFVGEGPGADEDRIGEPFVGRAGKLLTSAIEAGLKMRRSDVFICNVVKCRPPQNRTPLPDEVESCFPYLEAQIKLVNPQVIVTLGQPAQLALCGLKEGITRLRGKWLEWQGVPLMPTFHPAYLLRNPPAKKDFWEDLKEVLKKLGRPIYSSQKESP